MKSLRLSGRARRSILGGCIALLGLIGTARATEQIAIAAPVNNAAFAYLFIAIDKGYFAEEGLEANIQALDGQIATSALIAGSIAYTSSPASAIGAIMKGVPLKVVYYAARRASEELWSFDSSAKTFSDLKGKPIAVAGRGGSEEVFVRLLLKAENLPSDFVGFTALGVGPTRVAALASGSQRYAMVNLIERGQLKQLGVLDGGHIVVDFRKVADMPNGGMATSEIELKEHRDRAKRVMRALLKGLAFMRQERDATVEVLARRFPNLARADLALSLDDAIDNATADGTISNEAAARELAVRAELMSVPQANVAPIEQVFDFSLLREGERELKAANWRPVR